MNNRPYVVAISFVLLIIFSHCSKVDMVKSNHKSVDQKLDRVLIIALTNNYNSRTMYEHELSFRLREMGYNMFSSVNIDKSKKKLFTKDEIIELIKEKNIDGVITMRLKDIKSEEKYTTSDRYISDMYNCHNYFFNYVDTYYNVYSWSYQPQQTVVIEANLFDAKSTDLVLQLDATIKNVDSEEERAGEITKSFAKSFHNSRMLKSKSN